MDLSIDLVEDRFHDNHHKDGGKNALHLASESGHVNIVSELLKNGAQIDLEQESDTTPDGEGEGDRALHFATENGHLEVIRELLKYKPDVSAISFGRKDSLCIASESGRLDIVKELLKHGAKLDDVKKPWGEQPLFHASKNGHLEIVKELLKLEANVEGDGDANQPLASAIEEGHIDVVKELLMNGATPNLEFETDSEHREVSISHLTTLRFVIEKGNIQMTKLLLAYKANPNLKSSDEAPLHVATKLGHHEIVLELLKNGSKVNLKTKKGESALHIASDNGYWICRNCD